MCELVMKMVLNAALTKRIIFVQNIPVKQTAVVFLLCERLFMSKEIIIQFSVGIQSQICNPNI